MKRILAATILAVLLLLGAGFFQGKTPLTKATGTVRADAGCSIASLNGSYAVDRQGTIVAQVPGLPAPPAPLAEVAVARFNGAGSFFGNATVNLGGLVANVPFTGTYTVNPDCTATDTVVTSLGITLHDASVVIGGGQRIIGTETDPFQVALVRAQRLGD